MLQRLGLIGEMARLLFGRPGLGQGAFRLPEGQDQATAEPNQSTGLQHHDARVQHDPSQIRAARKNRHRHEEVQRQMMQGDGGGGDQQAPRAAIKRDHGEPGKKVHVDIDLPVLALKQVHQH